MSRDKNKHLRLAGRPADYQKLGIDPVEVARAPLIKRPIAKISGFDGAYHRFTGQVTIEKFEKDMHVEIFNDNAILPLMHFGKARTPAPRSKQTSS
jgi:hypothetical protein